MNVPAPDCFRILSIDGGGVRGFLAAGILANIEDYLNRAMNENLPLGARFDFIAGTSVGGLLALGLAAGNKASDLRELLRELIPAVFGAQNRRWKLAWLKSPRYHAQPLAQELMKLFGERTMADLTTDACITSVSLIDAKPKLHKTDYFTRNASRLDERLADVAMATSAAPTYFPAHSSKHNANLVDGGLVANNPAMVALVDALQFERSSKRGIGKPSLEIGGPGGPVLLSVGTGQLGPLPYDCGKLSDGGLVDWALPIYEVILLSQSQLVHHQVKFLVAQGRYLRVDPILNVAVELDDAEHFADLRNKVDVDADCERFLKDNFLSVSRR
jgi:hypothetical protein